MKPTKKKPTEKDSSIIVVKSSGGFELRFWDRLLGDSPIGPRLGRKDGVPSLPTRASTWSNALDLQQRWQGWLDAQPVTGGGRKRR